MTITLVYVYKELCIFGRITNLITITKYKI